MSFFYDKSKTRAKYLKLLLIERAHTHAHLMIFFLCWPKKYPRDCKLKLSRTSSFNSLRQFLFMNYLPHRKKTQIEEDEVRKKKREIIFESPLAKQLHYVPLRLIWWSILRLFKFMTLFCCCCWCVASFYYLMQSFRERDVNIHIKVRVLMDLVANKNFNCFLKFNF